MARRARGRHQLTVARGSMNGVSESLPDAQVARVFRQHALGMKLKPHQKIAPSGS